jgi:hypothetical protein
MPGLMRFYVAGKPREHALADMVKLAAQNFGYAFERVQAEDYDKPDPSVEVACIWGVKRPSRKFMNDHKRAGIKTLFFDKGYTRRPADKQDRIRVSANALQPTDYMMKNGTLHPDRFRRLGVHHQSKRMFGKDDHILLLGSSQKFHDWFPEATDAPNAMEFYEAIVAELRGFTDRPIMWRPKPSWRASLEIKGTQFSGKRQVLEGALDFAHSVIVTGSGASFYTLAAGVPTFIMPGFQNVASCIAGEDYLSAADDEPFVPGELERWKFCCNVAYQEWTHAELAAGDWLDYLKGVGEL